MHSQSHIGVCADLWTTNPALFTAYLQNGMNGVAGGTFCRELNMNVAAKLYVHKSDHAGASAILSKQ